MDRLMTLGFILGWVLGVSGTLSFLVCAVGHYCYLGSIQHQMEQALGVRRIFPTWKLFVAAMVGWCLVYLCH